MLKEKLEAIPKKILFSFIILFVAVSIIVVIMLIPTTSPAPATSPAPQKETTVFSEKEVETFFDEEGNLEGVVVDKKEYSASEVETIKNENGEVEYILENNEDATVKATVKKDGTIVVVKTTKKENDDSVEGSETAKSEALEPSGETTLASKEDKADETLATTKASTAGTNKATTSGTTTGTTAGTTAATTTKAPEAPKDTTAATTTTKAPAPPKESEEATTKAPVVRPASGYKQNIADAILKDRLYVSNTVHTSWDDYTTDYGSSIPKEAYDKALAVCNEWGKLTNTWSVATVEQKLMAISVESLDCYKDHLDAEDWPLPLPLGQLNTRFYIKEKDGTGLARIVKITATGCDSKTIAELESKMPEYILKNEFMWAKAYYDNTTNKTTLWFISAYWRPRVL